MASSFTVRHARPSGALRNLIREAPPVPQTGDFGQQLFSVAVHAITNGRGPEAKIIIGRCESPIEKLMLVGFWGRSVAQALTKTEYTLEQDSKVVQGLAASAPHILLAQQARIGNRRVDFLLASAQRSVVVECDGRDFHDRTNSQITADKSRDRELVAAGYPVMRFSGAEIWRNANACVDQVLAFLTEKEAAA